MVQLREKSRRTLSPDQLGSYIRVSRPSVWAVLGTIAVLVVAGAVWFFAGTVSEHAVGPAVQKGASVVAYVPLSAACDVKIGDPVVLEQGDCQLEGQVREVGEAPVPLTAVEDACGTSDLPSFSQDTWAVEVAVDAEGPAGLYTARIVTATHRPIRLLLGLD